MWQQIVVKIWKADLLIGNKMCIRDRFASDDTIGMTSQLESKAMVDDGVQIIRIAGKDVYKRQDITLQLQCTEMGFLYKGYEII